MVTVKVMDESEERGRGASCWGVEIGAGNSDAEGPAQSDTFT